MTGLPTGSDYARAGAAGAPGTRGRDARSRAPSPPGRYRAAPLPRREGPDGGPRPLVGTGYGSSAGPGTPPACAREKAAPAGRAPGGQGQCVPGAEEIGQKERGPAHRPLALRSGPAAGRRAPPAVPRRQLGSAADRQPRPRPGSLQRLHQPGCGPPVN